MLGRRGGGRGSISGGRGSISGGQDKPKKENLNMRDAAVIIQRVWRRYNVRQPFCLISDDGVENHRILRSFSSIEN